MDRENMLIIGIAGGSGSGKTTLVRALTQKFGDDITVISHDNYYRAHPEYSMEEREKLNYDCPEAFETELLIGHLHDLRRGRAVNCPTYDFTVHNRGTEIRRVEPKKVIVVEGILLFADPALRREFDIRIFVDADADVRLCRRIRRDVRKRGRTLESVIEQYLTTVKPMHERYVEPSKKFADVVVPEGGRNLIALEMIIGRIQKVIDAPLP